jgi:hypothetical protein
MTGEYKVLVTRSSATHGRPWETEPHHIQAIKRNHSDLVKFRRKDMYYHIVSQHLREFADKACAVIQARSRNTSGRN